MKVGLKPKKFFHDIIVLPRKEAKKLEIEIEEHRQKRIICQDRLVLDAILPEDQVKKGVSKLWQGIREEETKLNSGRAERSIEEVAEEILKEDNQLESISLQRIRPKTLLKNSLLLFLELSFVALMLYNAVSLYFEKNWLTEKINNLSLASKAHIAQAEESIYALNRNRSNEEIDKADIKLSAIREELINQGEYSYILSSHPLVSNKLTLGQNMLELGLLIKDMNKDINSVLDEVLNDKKAGGDLRGRAANLEPIIERVDQRVNRADVILKTDPEVKGILGTETGEKVEQILDKAKIELTKTKKLLEIFPLILGKNGDNRYLVLFLNNAEMRPGGGFPGNYGVLSFKNNNYQSTEVNDIYYLQWLKREKITKLDNDRDTKGIDPRAAVGLPLGLYLPAPLDEISKKGYVNLFSSNWSLDFRENAARAVYLYENVYEQGQVEGVIALTPNVVEDILDVVGPIKMEEYGVELTKDNFRQLIEYKVEFDNPYKTEGRREINPKQILADFSPKLMERISAADLGEKIKILSTLGDNLNKKQLLLYHQESKVENFISQLNASGEVRDYSGDFLGIAHLNINGQKNGQAIERTVKFSSQVNSLGFAKDELNLTVLLNENNPRPLHQWDRSYVEVIVPEGSRIREARIDGRDFIGEVDYFAEAGHTVFGFWIELEPGEAKNIVLKYQAPLKEYSASGYSLNLFKQAGAQPIEFEGEINFDNSEQYGLNPKFIRESIDKDKVIKF